jgi:hypothetical protein
LDNSAAPAAKSNKKAAPPAKKVPHITITPRQTPR